MGDSDLPSPAVIVGIDGSLAAVDAALWAVDEAVSRDIPLRLVYVIDSGEASRPTRGAAELDTAELAIRRAVITVESTDKPVKVEAEILRGHPTGALLEASRSAAIICVGHPVVTHAIGDRLASPAAELLGSARCPVAVVRSGPGTSGTPGWIVVEFDESPAGNRVLQHGLEEARLRCAPMRVLTTSRLRFTDIHDTATVAVRKRWAKTNLERSLAPWRRRFPDVDMKAVALQGMVLNYLAKHVASIQLVVADGDRAEQLDDLLRPPGHSVIHGTDCSVMICGRRHPLRPLRR